MAARHNFDFSKLAIRLSFPGIYNHQRELIEKPYNKDLEPDRLENFVALLRGKSEENLTGLFNDYMAPDNFRLMGAQVKLYDSIADKPRIYQALGANILGSLPPRLPLIINRVGLLLHNHRDDLEKLTLLYTKIDERR